MVVVAQLVRALDCGSRGRRFETGLPPFLTLAALGQDYPRAAIVSEALIT